MAKLIYKNGVTGVILRVKLLDTASTTGAGKTGLTNASAGLIVSTIADNEATATAYTSAGSTIDTITTLGTFAAPTASHCRFKEVDATNHPGIYEVQIADARWAVSSARSIIVTVQATGAAAADAEVQLSAMDLNDGTAGGISRIDATISSRPTAAQNATAIWQDTTASSDFSTAGSIGLLLKTDVDAAISSRLPTSSYTAPPSAATIATTVWQDLTASSDFTTNNSIGKLLVTDIDTNIGSRLASGSYTAPPSAASIATTVWTDLLASSDFSTASSIGALLKTDVDAQISTRLPTSSYTAPPTTAQIATAMWQDLTASSDFTTVGSIGKLLATDIDAAISSRSTYAGADTPGTTTLLTRLPSAITFTSGNVNSAPQTNVNLNLSQAVPTSNTAQTVGDALNAARAQAFGKWTIVGTTLTLYAADGTTAVRTFTLDSSTSPTSRT